MNGRVAKRLKKEAFNLCPYPDKENRAKTQYPTFEYTDESPRKIYQRLKKEYMK